MTMDEALTILVQVGGSDLHIKAGLPLMIRRDGELLPADMPPLSFSKTGEMLLSIINDNQKEKLEREKELDFSYNIDGLARFRGNIFYQKGVMG